MSDNFISERMEPHFLGCFETNYVIQNLQLKGNRISHACIKKIRKM
jgi:hypothetical protein